MSLSRDPHSATKLFTVSTMAARFDRIVPRARKYHAILEYSRGKRQICWIDYRTLFEELMSENTCTFALRKYVDVTWIVLKKSACFQYSISWSNAWLLSYEQPKRSSGVVVCKFFWEMDRNEKCWIKNARGGSDLCLSLIFILLES